MTAQIRPNRMEVNDRFPMLGFAVRTDEPNLDAEVVLATDIALFQPQNRTSRTAANFYSTREHGVLAVPRGEGVFVVPPEVLARFIGSEKLYFGLATGRTANGGLHVDALPREGSPYVSLRGFTGRTLRRGFGSSRGVNPPVLEWTGDAARPGSEPSNGAKAGNGNGNGAAAIRANGGGNGNGASANGGAAADYDDGFGPMPAIPAREASYRGGARPMGYAQGARQQFGLMLDDRLTAEEALRWIQRKVEQVVDVVGSDVNPPQVLRLDASQSQTFRRAWEIGMGAVGIFGGVAGFLAELPSLADRTGITLSVGPAVDGVVFGVGAGVVFEPGGLVALFVEGNISFDVSSLVEFVKSLKLALQAKLKLGYNRDGINEFLNIGKVAQVMVGAELVGGAELWLNRQGQGIGGAVSIGVGFALQLEAEQVERQRANRIGGEFGVRVGEALDTGLDPRTLVPLLDALDPPSTPRQMAVYGYGKSDDEAIVMSPPPAPRARAMNAAVGAAVAIGGFLLTTLRDSKGDVTWENDEFRAIKHPNDTPPANPDPMTDGATIRLDDWPVSGGLVDDISAWFKIDWQYNGRSLGNVRITNIGTNDAIGWKLHVRAQIMDDNRLYPPTDCAALRLTFHYQFSRSIGSDVIAIRYVTLYGDGTWESSGEWVQSSALAVSHGAYRA